MKRLFLISLVFSLFLTHAFAQNAAQKKQNQATLDYIKFNPILSQTRKPTSIDSLLNLHSTIANIEMPIAKLSSNYYYNTPVKKLSGKGLSAMPGTEPLDIMEAKQDSFVKKNRVIKITTFPPKEETKNKSSNPITSK